MRQLPVQHRILAAIMGFILIAAVAGYVVFVRPVSRKTARLDDDLTQKRRNLSRRGWPLDAERLEKLLDEVKVLLQGPGGRSPATALEASGVQNRSKLLLAECTGMFARRIARSFGKPKDFIMGVSRLDFQDEFNRLKQDLGSRGIVLDERVLNLGEDTSWPYTYQLLLQTWTVDILTQLVTASGLEFSRVMERSVQTEEGRARHPAKISVMPMVAYYASQEDEEPYVLEFPVKMELHGGLEELVGFLDSLHSEDNFFPVSRFELFGDKPTDGANIRSGHVDIDKMSVEVECCAFFRL